MKNWNTSTIESEIFKAMLANRYLLDSFLPNKQHLDVPEVAETSFKAGIDAGQDYAFQKIVRALRNFDMSYSLETHEFSAPPKKWADWLDANKENIIP